MSTGPVTNAPGAQVDEFARAYGDMRTDSDIQFTQVEMPQATPPQTPDWLADFFDWLGERLQPGTEALVSSWPVVKWVLVATFALLLLWIAWRTFGPDLLSSKGRRNPAEEWTPDQQAAIALLDDADRLAAEGRFDEATHLLLQRSIGQIAEAQPDLVEPSSTAREIASEPALPDNVRTAFGVIAERVERSLFALRHLSQDDWQAARTAYAEFALAQKAIGG